MIRAVFSDVDGTLLNSFHRVSDRTRDAILSLQAKGVPFVIASARSPFGVYPLEKRAGISCPIIAYSGALIQDETGRILYNSGLERDEAADIIRFIEEKELDCAWCAYIGDEWLVVDRNDPRIVNEENIVESVSREGRVEQLSAELPVNKILCICSEESIDHVESTLKEEYPYLAIYRSSDILVEIMKGGTNKAAAVRRLCDMWDIAVEDTAAFGDNYNDAEMLDAVGHGVIMGNAPAELLRRFNHVTADNDHDGIAHELDRLMRGTD